MCPHDDYLAEFAEGYEVGFAEGYDVGYEHGKADMEFYLSELLRDCE